MGLLDGVLGSLMGGGQQQGGSNPLLQIALQMLTQQGGGAGAGGGGGGLGGLINSFQQAGLTDQVSSWIGTGQNMPVSADQISQALGSGRIADIANQLGMGHGDVAGGLAQILPQLIDKATPNGQVPEHHSMIEDALSMLMKR